MNDTSAASSHAASPEVPNFASLGLAAAFVPVRGRTLGAWVPVATAYLAAGVTGRRREVASSPFVPAPRRPSAFVPFDIVAVERGAARPFGAISDRRGT